MLISRNKAHCGVNDKKKKKKNTGLPLSDSSVPWSIRETSQRDTR